MKVALICLILGCVSFCPAQELSPRLGESATVQRLFKFSGALTNSRSTGTAGTVSVRFTIYNQPDGGEAYWQETQVVRADAQGNYTVLLGETTLGGLPLDIFASRRTHWLGVQASGQAEQPRILLVELPSAWKPDPVNTAAPAREKVMIPSNPSERYLAMLLLLMFLVGTALACLEVAKWRRTRIERFGEPPLVNPLSAVPGPGKLRGAAQVFWFPLAHKLRSVRARFRQSIESVDQDRTNKAA